MVQGVFAYNDGFLFQSQLRRNGRRHAYAFIEHGGMWADVFIISPLIAWILTHYQLEHTSVFGVMSLVIIVMFLLGVGLMYSQGGNEAHTHDGKTTMAGWVHAVYAMGALWVFVLFFLRVPKPDVHDLLRIGIILTVFFPLGVVKFNREWRFKTGDAIQIVSCTVVLWCAIAIRLS